MRQIGGHWALVLALAMLLMPRVAVAGPPLSGNTPAEKPPADTPGAQPDAAAQPASPEPAEAPWAKGVPVETRAAATALFEQGSELLRELLFAEALAKYEEAIALWDHPAIRYRMARAQYNVGQPIAAYDNLQRALRYGQAPLDERDYEQALRFQALLAGQLAWLEVRCDEPGAEVTLNGELVFRGPGRAVKMLLPGRHAIVAKKPGLVPDTRSVELARGGRASVSVAPMSFDEATVVTRRYAVWKPWAVVGAGAAVTLAGGLLRWRAGVNLARFDEKFGSDDACQYGCTNNQASDDVQDLLRRGQWQNRIGVAGLVIGPGAAIAGAVLVALNRPRRERRTEQAASASPVVLLPTLGQGHAGLTLHIGF